MINVTEIKMTLIKLLVNKHDIVSKLRYSSEVQNFN